MSRNNYVECLDMQWSARCRSYPENDHALNSVLHYNVSIRSRKLYLTASHHLADPSPMAHTVKPVCLQSTAFTSQPMPIKITVSYIKLRAHAIIINVTAFTTSEYLRFYFNRLLPVVQLNSALELAGLVTPFDPNRVLLFCSMDGRILRSCRNL